MWNSLWNDAPALNRIATVLALVAFVMIGTVFVKKAAARPEFAIRSVVVTGKLVNADPAHIAAVVHHELRGTFFTIDLATARDALQRVTWVRRVSVRREWPSRIEIAIDEHRPLARWNDVSLVNTHGEVFDAEFGDDLPSFYAPDGTSAEVAARYREFAALIERNPGNDAAIESLTRSARGAWDVKLDDGLTVALGREQVSERWMRWIQVGERYRTRIGQGREIAAIDMRYPNGFAARVVGDLPRDGGAGSKGGAKGAANGAFVHLAKASAVPARPAAAAPATKVSAAKTAAKG